MAADGDREGGAVETVGPEAEQADNTNGAANGHVAPPAPPRQADRHRGVDQVADQGLSGEPV